VARTVGITLLSRFSNVGLRGTLVVCVECFESKVLFTVPRDAELREVSCAWREIAQWVLVAPFGGRLYALWARPPGSSVCLSRVSFPPSMHTNVR